MLFEKQQHQQDCVENIVRALDGVDFARADFSALASNLRVLAKGIPTLNSYDILSQRRLDVLMETGTGKTFVYLQTILELNKRYGLRKFIIVLPRVAIKQGVIQNINLTDEYFFNIYGKHINYIDYPAAGLDRIQSDFIGGTDLCVLVTTSAAFNSEKNRINKKRETFFEHGSIWSGIASSKPVVVIDEPHLLKGTETKKGLDKLTDSLFIRFGATFPQEDAHKLSNVVYALDSISAFNQHLVKRIGVSTVYSGSQQGNVAVTNIHVKEGYFDFCFSRSGQPQKVVLRKGDDVGAKSGLASYAGKVVTKISSAKISLSDRRELEARISYTLHEEEMRPMVRHAIDLHFAKEQRLFKQGIKALTLMFIPGISDYRCKNPGDNPLVKRIFEKEYADARKKFYAAADAEYRAYLDNDYDADGKLRVHQGYFSGDKGSKEEQEREQIDIILGDKERLLSLDEPLRFVFSVWALQEGWDNPNIFTICKLAPSSEETSRRQQVGRGLRLAVNKDGQRLTERHLQGDEPAFYEINTLDMVVSGQEHAFIHQIQNEINEASRAFVGDVLTLDVMKDKGLTDFEASLIFFQLLNGDVIDTDGKIQSPIAEFLKSNRDLFSRISNERFEEICAIFGSANFQVVVNNNQRPRKVKIKQEQWLQFKELWETINRRARIVYQPIDEATLIEQISRRFNDEDIKPRKSYARGELLNTQNDEIDTLFETEIAHHVALSFDLSTFVREFAREEKLPLKFICDLFTALKTKSFQNDAAKARKLLVHHMKERIHDGMLHQVDYQLVQTDICPNGLQEKDGSSIGELMFTHLGARISNHSPTPSHFLYDKIVYDSEIERESIADGPMRVDDCQIKVFAKLPSIKIPTPYKAYTPDFAYFIEGKNGKVLFLVVETKGYDKADSISLEERTKMDYGRKFFEWLDRELPDVKVAYKARINQQTLGDLLADIGWK